MKLCHGRVTEPLSSKSQRAECALGSAARFAASRRWAPLLLQRASWSALMPWAEITSFALLPSIVHPGSSLAEVGEHGEGTRLLGTAQLSAPSHQLPPAPAAPRTGLNAAAFCPREPFLVCGETETPAGTSGTKAHPPPNQHHGQTAQTEAPATCKSPGRWEVSRGPLGCPHPPAGSSPQGTSAADALPALLSPQPCSHPTALTRVFPSQRHSASTSKLGRAVRQERGIFCSRRGRGCPQSTLKAPCCQKALRKRLGGGLRWVQHGARARPALRGTRGTGSALTSLLGPTSRFSFTPRQLRGVLELMELEQTGCFFHTEQVHPSITCNKAPASSLRWRRDYSLF